MTTPTAISWLKYGWETTFATVTTNFDKQFGRDVRIGSLTRRNNVQRMYSCGYRNAQVLQPLKFEGMKVIECALANPWAFKGILGASATTGAGPYTHTFTEADALTSFSIENNIPTDTASVAKLLGCAFKSITLSNNVGEVSRMRLTVPFANETHGSTTSAKVAETFAPMVFSHGTIELPNGTTLSRLQSVDLTINMNVQYLWGGGSRFASAGVGLAREYSVNITKTYEGVTDLLHKLYGGATGPVVAPAETATMELVWDNGLTGTSQRQISALFTGVQLDEHNMPQDPTAVIMESAPLMMRSLGVTAINNTSAVP